MKGDFSRDTFDVTKHFSRVLQQQGRVQLDADSNEQTAILLHYLRTLAADLIGPFAGPEGEACGFNITIEDPAKLSDLKIGTGRYYVDGILCENDGNEAITYNKQKDYPNPNPSLDKLKKESKYLVYLDVWERHITALEDEYIREKALNGVDTATRAQVVWQVKIWLDAPQSSYTNFTKQVILTNWKDWVDTFQKPPFGCLRARVKPSVDSKDPCLMPPEARYRGPENQLYRVEIHKEGKTGTATFKWSRENGSVVTACELKGNELIVENSRGFADKQWVELTNDELELRGQPGSLVRVNKVEGNTLTLYAQPDKPDGLQIQEKWPTKVRGWDHREITGNKLQSGAVTIEEVQIANKDNDDAWITLENGIQIQFLKPSTGNGNKYQTGDYWLIPARAATGDIEWPLKLKADGSVEVDKNNQTIPLPPKGIRHHYAPLAILSVNSNKWKEEDLRCQYKPIEKSGVISCISESYGEEGIGGHLDCEPLAK